MRAQSVEFIGETNADSQQEYSSAADAWPTLPENVDIPHGRGQGENGATLPNGGAGRCERDAGISLAGGRLRDDHEDSTSDSGRTDATLPPPYFSIPYT